MKTMIYEDLFVRMPLPIALVDENMVIVNACQEFCSRVERSKSALTGERLLELFETVSPNGSGEMACHFVPDLPTEISATLASADGSTAATPHRLRIYPLDLATERHGLVVLIDEQDETVQDLDDLTVKIRAIKHDMSNPLTGALGNITLLLRRSDLDEKTRQRLVTAEKELKKVSQGLADLADLVPQRAKAP